MNAVVSYIACSINNGLRVLLKNQGNVYLQIATLKLKSNDNNQICSLKPVVTLSKQIRTNHMRDNCLYMFGHDLDMFTAQKGRNV